MKHAVLFIVLLAILFSADWLPLAYSIPLYAKDLPSSLKDHCTTRHTSPSGKGGLNRFGSDYEYYGYSIERIFKLDSDRDGYTNSQELAAGTFPGDPNAYPGSGSSGIEIELIVFVSVALVAGVTLFWLRRSRL